MSKSLQAIQIVHERFDCPSYFIFNILKDAQLLHSALHPKYLKWKVQEMPQSQIAANSWYLEEEHMHET